MARCDAHQLLNIIVAAHRRLSPHRAFTHSPMLQASGLAEIAVISPHSAAAGSRSTVRQQSHVTIRFKNVQSTIRCCRSAASVLVPQVPTLDTSTRPWCRKRRRLPGLFSDIALSHLAHLPVASSVNSSAAVPRPAQAARPCAASDACCRGDSCAAAQTVRRWPQPGQCWFRPQPCSKPACCQQWCC